MKKKCPDGAFFVTGLLLLLSEIWKQWCLTFVVGGGVYNWWYFPFQLCSMPMYLLLLYSWLKSRRAKKAVLSFFMDYTLLGGLAVWMDTSGLFYVLPALTVHSFVWHVVLIGVGLAAGHVQDGTRTWQEFWDGTMIYGAGCLIASIINALVSGRANINMFYMNPAYPMTQPVFDRIAARWGQIPSILLYAASTVCGAGLLHGLWCIRGRKKLLDLS